MNLVLTHAERKRAKLLVRRTSKNGADATLELLPHFHADSWPALIAFLAGAACEAKNLPHPVDAIKCARNQPDLLTEPQRREAHRRYLYGERTPEVVAGEREYQRIKARKYRAEKLGETA